VAVGWVGMPLCRLVGVGVAGGWSLAVDVEVLRVWMVGLDEFWVDELVLGALSPFQGVRPSPGLQSRGARPNLWLRLGELCLIRFYGPEHHVIL